MAKLFKYTFLLSFGGILYLLTELLWRGYSHWSMFLLGGTCFTLPGLINKKYTRTIPLWIQMLACTFVITTLEFITGCIVNLHFHLNVWDYSDIPLNINGQICLPYMFLWFVISLPCIVTGDYVRHLFFNEDKPHYRLI